MLDLNVPGTGLKAVGRYGPEENCQRVLRVPDVAPLKAWREGLTRVLKVG